MSRGPEINGPNPAVQITKRMKLEREKNQDSREAELAMSDRSQGEAALCSGGSKITNDFGIKTETSHENTRLLTPRGKGLWINTNSAIRGLVDDPR